ALGSDIGVMSDDVLRGGAAIIDVERASGGGAGDEPAAVGFGSHYGLEEGIGFQFNEAVGLNVHAAAVDGAGIVDADKGPVGVGEIHLGVGRAGLDESPRGAGGVAAGIAGGKGGDRDIAFGLEQRSRDGGVHHG